VVFSAPQIFLRWIFLSSELLLKIIVFFEQ
jgi:hypothetical protein